MKDRIVKVEQGYLRGNFGADPRVKIFRGVPYAEPPVGVLRWRPPQKKEPWDGIRDALLYGPIAMQRRQSADLKDFWVREMHPAGDDFAMREDCLYLNIYTPAKSGKEDLPVLVHIHGGAFLVGYPFEQELDFEHMAAKGIVVVGISFRLGVFGFFAHPELTAENPSEVKGNYGLLDLACAIRWIHDNIAAFGGNPNRITLAGQSAGASAVQMLLTAEDTKGLISKAIIQSALSVEFQDAKRSMWSLRDAEKAGEEFFRAAGLTSLQEARSASAALLLKKTELLGNALHFRPVIDGKFLKETSFSALMTGKWPKIPVLAGFNTGDVRVDIFLERDYPKTTEDFMRYTESFEEERIRFLSVCGIHSARDIDGFFQQDAYEVMRVGTYFGGRILDLLGQPGYLYIFDARLPGDYDKTAFHGAELWYSYDALARSWRPFTGQDYDLSRQMSSYWANFIKNGDPNGVDQNGFDLPEWEAYKNDRPMVMHFKDSSREEMVEINELMKFRMDFTLSRFNEKYKDREETAEK